MADLFWGVVWFAGGAAFCLVYPSKVRSVHDRIKNWFKDSPSDKSP